MPQISKLVRDALKGQLSAEETGFNARLAALWRSYGLPPEDLPVIDWTSESANFLFGRVNPAGIERSSVFAYPLVTIDTLRSQNTNRVKFATFAGPVQAVIDVHHSWPDSSVIADFASYVDATEDAIIAALNDQAALWPGNLLWNGNVGMQRGAVLMGGYGWLQTASFFCQFDLLA